MKILEVPSFPPKGNLQVRLCRSGPFSQDPCQKTGSCHRSRGPNRRRRYERGCVCRAAPHTDKTHPHTFLPYLDRSCPPQYWMNNEVEPRPLLPYLHAPRPQIPADPLQSTLILLPFLFHFLSSFGPIGSARKKGTGFSAPGFPRDDEPRPFGRPLMAIETTGARNSEATTTTSPDSSSPARETPMPALPTAALRRLRPPP